jgi:hypothetical protein
MVDHLLCKHEALSSNPTHIKKKKERKRKIRMVTKLLQNGKTYLQIIYLISNWYPEYNKVKTLQLNDKCQRI